MSINRAPAGTARWLGVVIGVVLAAPGTAAAVGNIDPYHHDVTGSSCSGGARPGATALLHWLSAHDAVGKSGGIYGCRPIAGSGILSLHAEGRAVDWMLDSRIARQRKIADGIVAAWLKRRHGRDHALARRMGIQEIIWNCRIWRADRPRAGLVAYGPCSSSPDRTARHENHVHVGLSHAGAERRTSFWARGPWPQDLVALQTAATPTPVRVLDGGTRYTSLLGRAAVRLNRTSSRPRVLYGDHDDDGVDDLFVLGNAGRSGRVTVSVFSGARHFDSQLLATRSALTAGLGAFAFGLGDHDHDGRLDLYAIKYRGARSTEVRVLSGADRYRSFLRSTATPLPRTSASTFQFAIGDRDNDGRDDIYAIRHQGVRATTVSVLDGATNFRSVQASVTTALPKRERARFVVGDRDDDGFEDIYAIERRRDRRTQVASLAGPRFQRLNLRTLAALRTAGTSTWAFALPAQPGL